MTNYSISEVASILHKSEQSVGRWLREGKLPYIQVSERRRLIRESDLERFLDSRIVTPLKKRIDNKNPDLIDWDKNCSLTTEYGDEETDVESLQKEIAQLCQ